MTEDDTDIDATRDGPHIDADPAAIPSLTTLVLHDPVVAPTAILMTLGQRHVPGPGAGVIPIALILPPPVRIITAVTAEGDAVTAPDLTTRMRVTTVGLDPDLHRDIQGTTEVKEEAEVVTRPTPPTLTIRRRGLEAGPGPDLLRPRIIVVEVKTHLQVVGVAQLGATEGSLKADIPGVETEVAITPKLLYSLGETNFFQIKELAGLVIH